MNKICFITAVPSSADSFLKDHMAALKNDYQVYYVSCEPDVTKITVEYDGYHCVGIERGISLVKDFKALIQLTKYFRKERFAAVHSVTPKAGLLTAMAGFIAGVPVRIHIFTGQVWANKKGPMRWLLKFMDKILVLFGNHFLVDGELSANYFVREVAHGTVAKVWYPSPTLGFERRRMTVYLPAGYNELSDKPKSVIRLNFPHF